MAKYDAIIVGSGPNGLSAAITLQKEGLSTLLIEGKSEIGGGLRTQQLSLPGFKHDVCASIHPLILGSPFFKNIPLESYGLQFIKPKYPCAHPLINGETAILFDNLAETVADLGCDGKTYANLIGNLVSGWDSLATDLLGPFRFPKNPLKTLRFGSAGILPAEIIAKLFRTNKARAMWAGMAAHSILPFSKWGTSAVALILCALGNKFSWPIARGGSGNIADALLAHYISIGGTVQANFHLSNVKDLPSHDLLFLDLTPRQITQVEGLGFSDSYIKKLSNFSYGSGVFKIDYALSDLTPFKDKRCQEAGTVHLGDSYEAISRSEKHAFYGVLTKKPLVLFSQQSAFDNTRAPEGRHTAWAYCHVPNGSQYDYSSIIECQIERYAPGFRDTILHRHLTFPKDFQDYNPNYIGGDISGGAMNLSQLYARPVSWVKPYRTQNNRIYICSSSTPPGGGVHGMCGYSAAKLALADHFDIKTTLL